MPLNLQSSKNVISPDPENIKDGEVKSVFKKLMAGNEEDRVKLYEDLKAIYRILAGIDAMQNALNMGSHLINNVTDPVNNQDAATKKYVVDLVGGVVTTITGEIRMYGGASAPTGWLLCDGSAVSRTTYAALFAIISTTYGVGDGSTTFNLPTFTGKFARGNTRGVGAGADTHSHSLAETNLPSHSHGIGTITAANESAHTHGGGVTGGQGPVPVTPSFTSGTTGAGSAHTHTLSGSTAAVGSGTAFTGDNIPAYTGVLFIIKT